MKTQPYTTDVPSECRDARETFGLRLAGENVPAPIHLATCDACSRATARMERIWTSAGEILPGLQPVPEARLDAMLENLLAESRTEPVMAAESARPVPAVAPRGTHVPREAARGRRESWGFAFGLTMAAGLAALVVMAPGLDGFRDSGQELSNSRSPRAAPAAPPRVTLAAAKGDVSTVPADGSIGATPKPGDPLSPGLFSASGGAALAIGEAGLLAVRGDASVVIGGAEGAPEVSVARGEIFVDLPPGTVQAFLVRTPTGVVRVTGTRFEVEVEGGETRVEVMRGSVVVGSPHGDRAVRAGEAARLPRNGAPVEALVSDPGEDPLRWVRELAPDRVPPAPVVAIAQPPRPDARGADVEDGAGVLYVAGLDKLVVENAMEKRQAAIRYCYEQALVRTPGLEVSAALRFRVDEDGRAKGLRITGLATGQQELAQCLHKAVEPAVFPPTVPDTEVRVRYPLKFEPAAD